MTDNAGTDFHCWYFRRFSTTLAADRICLQTMTQYGCDQTGGPDILGEALLPPPNCNLQASEARVCDAGGGCNASCSGSGNYQARWNASHALTYIDRVAWPTRTGTFYTTTMHIDSVKKWAGYTNDSIGGDAELIRWAANSDKWILQQVGWYGHAGEIMKGSNQLAANWIDKAGIRLSWNPKIPVDPNPAGSGVITYGNCAGDMWIDGGPENLGKWEDTAGVWHAVPGYSPTGVLYSPMRGTARRQLTYSVSTGGVLHVYLPGPQLTQVRIVNSMGKCEYAASARGCLLVGAGALNPGMYLIIAKYENKAICSAVTISR